LDLNRIFLLHYSSEKLFTGIGRNTVRYIPILIAILTHQENETLKSVTLKALCNLFYHNGSTKRMFEVTAEALKGIKVEKGLKPGT